MARKTIAQAYAELNALWPKDLPKLTAGEAVRAGRRLWRYGMGETPVAEATSGNRFSYRRFVPGRGLVLFCNPGRGWREFVHELSHAMYSEANRGEKPHAKEHARFEAKLVREVIKRGWLDGRLRDKERPAPDLDAKKLASIEARIVKWERKRKLASTWIKKLERQRRYYLKKRGE